jgi:hypothetical protein
MHPVRLGLTLLVIVLASLTGWLVPAARADNGVIPQSDSLPWTDPNHSSDLEQLMTRISSTIANRQVRDYCNGETDWNALAGKGDFDPTSISGYVASPQHYWVFSRTFADSSAYAQFSPRACWYLWKFAMATTKPTKCATTITTPVTKTVTTTKRVKVCKRVKVKGHWKKRCHWETRKLKSHYVDEVESPGPPAPCYGTDGVTPEGGWSEYDAYAFAILTLAHESIHLFDLAEGHSIDQPFEARAQCFGVQESPWIAAQLGASPDDARSIAQYLWDEVYPRYQGTPYWSADCRQDGPLDLSPGDGVWP